MNTRIRQQLARRKRRLQRRLDKTRLGDISRPVLSARNIHYEIAERAQGMAHGGIGAFHLLARRLGLIEAIDRNLHLLTIHLPYHESDHVLTLAYNALCGGECLQDIEHLRQDVTFLDALDAQRIPDPTTAGDFCRRFQVADINRLQDTLDEVRVRVWQQQPNSFFDCATLDADGTLVATAGQCKEGIEIAYDGTWGYHPLLVTLANTGEVLRLVNRPGNRPSHEGAAAALDQAIATCVRAGFRQVLLRGDTDFSQTAHLDRWDANPRIRFIFGYDAKPNLIAEAEELPASAWRPLQRRQPPPPATGPRQRAGNVKDGLVRAHGFETLRLCSEEVAEFAYQPVACREVYRMIVVRKNISREKGELCLFDEVRYFFYITNEWNKEPFEMVLAPYGANGRCQQENVIQQVQGGVHALKAPLDSLLSNWAYMVMTSLAWNLKAWAALSLPETGRWAEKYRADKLWLLGLEFKAFVQVMVSIPCQIVRQARRLVYRILNYHPHRHLFFRLLDVLRC